MNLRLVSSSQAGDAPVVAHRNQRIGLLLIASVGLSVGLALVAGAADPAKDGKPAPKSFKEELPRIPPKSPAEAMATFQVHPGFHLDQAAAEPLVHSPVAISFDEQGRAYVAEMIDYSEQATEHLGAVRRLTDRDGDGRFDESTVFAEKLSWPTAIVCYDGGVFIGAAPDIWYCKDTDGDGKADITRKVYTGFGRQNVQGLFNSFQWGLDGRIHCATSTVGGQVSRVDQPGQPPINLNGRDFAFNPRTLELKPTSGGAQHGMSFDNWGRKFLCSNSDHIQMVVFDDRYAARNPYVAAPSPRISIAADGPQAEVYRISPLEPWRIVRTRLRVSGAVAGIVEGGGRAGGYFTGATGTTIYRGDAFGPDYVGQAFVGDVGSNIIHRKVLEPTGVTLTAKRVDEGKEFVASTDIWFRPAQYANAPDGCLYILDVYREVIEHPASLPPEIKQHLDLTSGRDRGRLYRLTPDNYRPRPLPNLGQAKLEELVATLEHPNGWHRDTAARLIWERDDAAVVAGLKALSTNSKLPEARLQAMYLLLNFKALTAELLQPRLADEHPRVREHAVRLLESIPDRDSLLQKLATMVNDADARVRFQTALTIGEFDRPELRSALVSLARADGGDRWIQFAILSALKQHGGAVLAELLNDSTTRGAASVRAIVRELAVMLGRMKNDAELTPVVKALEQAAAADPGIVSIVLRGLYEGSGRNWLTAANGNEQLASRMTALLGPLVAHARQKAQDASLSPAERAAGLQALSLGSWKETQDLLTASLGHKQPRELQVAAISVIGEMSDPEIGTVLVTAWPGFSPAVRSNAAGALYSRGPWLLQFLKAVDAGTIPPTDVEPARLKLLESHRDPEVKALAAKLAARLKVGRRQDVLEQYQAALTMKGDPERGAALYKKVCSGCHKIGDVGYEIGPNLISFKTKGADAILLNVIDPNREVNPQYVNYICETDDGRTLTGLIAGETAASVVLKRAENATDTILRSEIETLKSTGLSIMPEGLERDIPVQGMADLLTYLMSVK